jgi:hypothetical protein
MDGWLDVTDLTTPASPSDLQKSTERGCLVVQGTPRRHGPCRHSLTARGALEAHHHGHPISTRRSLQPSNTRQPWVAHHKGEKRDFDRSHQAAFEKASRRRLKPRGCWNPPDPIDRKTAPKCHFQVNAPTSAGVPHPLMHIPPLKEDITQPGKPEC